MDQERLDALWAMAGPAGSEARLRAAAGAEDDPGTRAELGTQVARALGLQGRYAEADVLLETWALDDVDECLATIAARDGGGQPTSTGNDAS